MKRFALAAVAALSFGLPAFAGEQFVDDTGFAVSGYDVVAYRSLAQAPVGQAQPAAVPGKADITAEYNGEHESALEGLLRELLMGTSEEYAPAEDTE